MVSAVQKKMTVSQQAMLRLTRTFACSALAFAFVTGNTFLSETRLSSLLSSAAYAQAVDPLTDQVISDDGELLLEADVLTYDQNNNSVIVTGNVQMYYNGNTLEADKVIYNRGTSELTATGNVRLTEPDGNVLRTDFLRLSDDFANGFSSTLQLDSADSTSFTADSAERKDGVITEISKGTYTACIPCQKKKQGRLLWQIKAQKIIINDKTKTVSYRNATFEFLGVPIAWFPYFAHPDPRVKRRTGLLNPRFSYSGDLGFGYTQPLYVVTGDTHDLTISPTILSKQGVLAELEWRQRFNNGAYDLQLAGIRQESPEEFSGTVGDEDERGGLRTTGSFNLNRKWKFGWDILATSDRLFPEHYNVLTDETERFESNIHLTGLGERKHFDARVVYFNQLDQDPSATQDLQEQQAVVLPQIDYDGVLNQSVLGGQLAFNSNFTAITREESELATINGQQFVDGLEGQSARASLELEWKRTFMAPGGQLISPILALRGDVSAYDNEDPLVTGLPDDELLFRGSATAGVEWRWPVLVQTENTSHIFEPIAQVFVRPNETGFDTALNQDAQSLIFDHNSLFTRDKFSGYDRIEGGTRTNIGLAYDGKIGEKLRLSALIGQSYQIAGLNSFSRQGTSSIYRDNGLEKDRSDYIARAGFKFDNYAFSGGVVLDEHDLNVNHASATASASFKHLSTSFSYENTDAEPLNVRQRSESVSASANLVLNDHFSFFGSTTYDLVDDDFEDTTFGARWHCECADVTLSYTEDFDDSDSSGRIYLSINLKTLGGAELAQDISSAGN